MSNKNLIWIPIILGIILVIGGAAFYILPKNVPNGVSQSGSLISANTDKDILPINKTPQNTTQMPAVANTANTQSTTMKIEEVATHNSESSCYVIYQKEVYDLTSFIGRHDGGAQAILDNCGKNINDLSAVHPGGNFSSPKVQRAIKALVIGKVE